MEASHGRGNAFLEEALQEKRYIATTDVVTKERDVTTKDLQR